MTGEDHVDRRTCDLRRHQSGFDYGANIVKVDDIGLQYLIGNEFSLRDWRVLTVSYLHLPKALCLPNLSM